MSGPCLDVKIRGCGTADTRCTHQESVGLCVPLINIYYITSGFADGSIIGLTICECQKNVPDCCTMVNYTRNVLENCMHDDYSIDVKLTVYVNDPPEGIGH